MKYNSLITRNMKEMYRDPVFMLLGFAMPVILLLLFSSIYRKSHIDMFSPQALAPGILIFSFAFLLLFSATLIAKDKQSAFLVRLFSTPLKPSDFIVSYLLPFIPIAVGQILACLFTGALLGATFSNLFFAFFIFLLIALICICLGMILGSLFTVNQVSGIGALFITAISLFSGVWMNLKVVGGVFETIGYAMPFAHGVDAVRTLLAGFGFSKMSNHFYVILIYTIISFVLAVLSFRWTMKKI